MRTKVLYPFGVLIVVIVNSYVSISKKKLKPKIRYELTGGAGHYSYAPSAIQYKKGIRYMFLCQNKDPFKTADHIYLYKGVSSGNGYIWQQRNEILSPSKSGWDDVHVCDPDVREFKLTYKGEEYNWIMTYLGVDQWGNNHNQIGLAFSKHIEGPYIKYDKNPLIRFSDTTKWGVGQSTSIVINSSSIQLFYSKSSTICVRDIKLNVLDSIFIGEEKIIPFLKSNTYFAYSKKNRYAVSEVRIDQSKEIPTWVGNHVRFVYKPLSESLFTKRSGWTEIGMVGPENTGFPRNHNPGLLTDSKGYVLSDDEAVIYFTVAMTGKNWLWSYNLYSATFDMKYHFNQ